MGFPPKRKEILENGGDTFCCATTVKQERGTNIIMTQGMHVNVGGGVGGAIPVGNGGAVGVQVGAGTGTGQKAPKQEQGREQERLRGRAPP